MSGILGIVHRESNRPIDMHTLHAMGRSIQSGALSTIAPAHHTGSGVALAMSRIIHDDPLVDQQPVTNEDGTIWAVLTGAIYNRAALVHDLLAKGHRLQAGDAAILPHLYEEQGLDFVHALNGMFAIAIWDSRARRLVLVRDRIGMKALYYATVDASLVFSSLLWAMTQHPDVDTAIDLYGLSEYLTFEHTVPPHTLLTGVQKLPAGHMAIYEDGGLHIREYWDMHIPPEDEKRPDEQHHIDRFSGGFLQAVKRRLPAHKPVGVFLSGGIDSSSVTAGAVLRGAPDVYTYAVGYPQGDLYEDLNYAALAARHFHTHHYKLIITPDDYARAVPEYVGHMGDLVADSACILTLLLAQRARQDVQIVLSGQGPDETLGSTYVANFQKRCDRLRRFQRIPRWLRQTLPDLLSPLLPTSVYSWLARGNRDLARINLEELHTLAWRFETDEKRRLIPALHDIDDPCRDIVYDTYVKSGTTDPVFQVIYIYTRLTIAENLTMHDDKMTAPYGVELRSPYLDHELIELIADIPSRYLVTRLPDDSYLSKSILHKAMRGVVPDEILNRRKQWFAVPLTEWLQSSLERYSRDVLLSDDARLAGLYDAAAVQSLLTDHHQQQAMSAMPLQHSFQIRSLTFLEVWRQLLQQQTHRSIGVAA